MSTARLPFVRNSSSHSLLFLAESQNRAGKTLTTEVASYVLGCFRDAHSIRKSARHLAKHGLLEVVGDNEWKITSTGYKALLDIVGKKQRIRNG